MIDVSVVICTHNPRRDYLDRVLEALRSQTLPLDRWELLLVDNASEQKLSDRWDLSWHSNARQVLEDKLGLAFARVRGITESTSLLLVFVDDDNLLSANYLERALEISETWPQLGVFGGQTIPEFEVPPPARYGDYLGMLALRSFTSAHWTNIPQCDQAIPWGAGMCVRREVAMKYQEYFRDSRLKITGRRGHSLLSGEDDEYSYIACEMGFGIGVFPELVLTHLISEQRLSDNYLLKLARGMETSHRLLSHKWHGHSLRSPYHPRNLLSLSYDLITQRGLKRRMRVTRFLGEIDAYRMIISHGAGPGTVSRV